LILSLALVENVAPFILFFTEIDAALSALGECALTNPAMEYLRIELFRKDQYAETIFEAFREGCQALGMGTADS
jgi:hypothetical protein